MLIFKLMQDIINDKYSYKACIVIAPTEERAKILSIKLLGSSNKWPKDMSSISSEILGGSSLSEQIVITSINLEKETKNEY